VDIAWDPKDPRLVFIETEGLTGGGDDKNQEQAVSEGVTLFVTTEQGIKRQDSV